MHFASSWFGPDYHFGVLGPSGSFARLGSAQLNSIERQSAAACRPISAAFFKPAPGHVPLIWLSLARRVFALMKCCEKVPRTNCQNVRSRYVARVRHPWYLTCACAGCTSHSVPTVSKAHLCKRCAPTFAILGDNELSAGGLDATLDCSGKHCSCCGHCGTRLALRIATLVHPPAITLATARGGGCVGRYRS